MRTKALPILLLVPALILGACGRLDDDGNDPGSPGGTGHSGSSGIEHPTGPGDLVLRVATAGGFVPPEFNLRAVPGFSLFGDGRVVVEGPMIEIYPGPALPNLQVSTISEDGIQAILAAARDAGLLGEDASYDFPCIADVGTTTFTVVAEGRTHTVSAYALGMDGGGGCPGVDEQARAALQAFSTKLGDLQRWLPDGSVVESGGYVPSELRVFVQDYGGDPQLRQDPVDWPLAQGLASFGRPDENLPDVRCGVVGGEDARTLLSAAGSANELTPWTSGGERFGLIFRPLLPDEHDC